MTSADSEAGTGQASQPADTGRGAPGPERAGQDSAAEQAGQSAAARPVPQEPVLPGPVLPGPVLPGPVLPGPVLSEPMLSAQSREDTDIAWGDYPRRDDDDRLYRDRPPHWADY